MSESDLQNHYNGSCLCGAVSFSIDGTLEHFFLCHCSRCRKDSGSAHSANLFSPTAVLNILSGQDKIQHYSVPNTRHARAFCSTCGSPLPSRNVSANVLQVPAGSLDNDPPLKPNALIHMASRACWVDLYRSANITMFDGLPSA
jgi:hypothetical protein